MLATAPQFGCDRAMTDEAAIDVSAVWSSSAVLKLGSAEIGKTNKTPSLVVSQRKQSVGFFFGA